MENTAGELREMVGQVPSPQPADQMIGDGLKMVQKVIETFRFGFRQRDFSQDEVDERVLTLKM